jgi:hypothetical protein
MQSFRGRSIKFVFRTNISDLGVGLDLGSAHFDEPGALLCKLLCFLVRVACGLSE